MLLWIRHIDRTGQNSQERWTTQRTTLRRRICDRWKWMWGIKLNSFSFVCDRHSHQSPRCLCKFPQAGSPADEDFHPVPLYPFDRFKVVGARPLLLLPLYVCGIGNSRQVLLGESGSLVLRECNGKSQDVKLWAVRQSQVATHWLIILIVYGAVGWRWEWGGLTAAIGEFVKSLKYYESKGGF